MKYFNRIKTEAAKRNISLKQLADSIDVTEDILKKALRNDTLSVGQLKIICGVLSLEMSDIFVRKPFGGIKQSSPDFFNNKLFC